MFGAIGSCLKVVPLICLNTCAEAVGGNDPGAKLFCVAS